MQIVSIGGRHVWVIYQAYLNFLVILGKNNPIRADPLCLSPMETVCMNVKSLFQGKIRKKKISAFCRLLN